ncbi:MotA/TolQ/ExbB proton channel family protein [uncultured Methanobrevibacter sp.]|uniref:MotA/TolQ/ExbB proton channel family protein n=1 Tax=uncultured Methanobrevibacter sp. TaxID=253161 RepID=UPI0015BA79AB|nr:MotA/TolQ/ExbB proton channel family protein [uncultured Methanobrevibacter sp.]
MNSTIPGSEYLTGTLDVISQSLSIPVLIILLILVIISIVVLGGFISEYTSRKKVSVKTVSDGIFSISSASSTEDLINIIGNMNIPKSQKRVLTEMAETGDLDKFSREALARKLVENEEEKIDKSLEKTDIITRIGPTLGLMGTLIPMGPGLAALGSGDINVLAQSLTVAFNTTIVGIGCGALCYVISKIRRGWYDKYISDLDALSDAVLDYMNR